MNTTHHKRLNLLVVEDTESDYELLLYRLKTGGISAHCVRVDNAPDLQRALDEQTWDMVISDHRLPGFSSEEALQIVRASAHNIPFIIVSGNIGEDVAVDAMRSGADDYLMKDNLKRLAPAIERSLRAAEERRERQAAERAQRESETRFAAIAANLPGVIFQMFTDKEGLHPNAPFVSDGALRLFGLPARVFLDDPSLFFKQFAPDSAADLRNHLTEQTQTHEPLSWEGQLVIHGADGPRWCFLSASSRLTGADELTWDGALIDITAQKTAEQQLRASQEELRRVTTEFEKRREEERGSIAREIHDDIGGTLTKLKADIAWLKKRYGAEQDANERFEDMLELIEHTVSASQRIAKDLRPGILDYGIVPALEWQMKDFTKRSGIAGSFTCNLEDLNLDVQRSTAIFRILQEGLTNIVKHAQATSVDVELFADDDSVTLEIRDNGKGIGLTDMEKKTSFGVKGMMERVRALDGWLDINGSPGRGTTLMLSVPRQ